jgi:hypothetical protein
MPDTVPDKPDPVADQPEKPDNDPKHAFDFPHDDPQVGPAHPTGPAAGVSVVLDGNAHLTQVGVTAPKLADGSDPFTFSTEQPDQPDRGPGWMPSPHTPEPTNCPVSPPPLQQPLLDPMWNVKAPDWMSHSQPGGEPPGDLQLHMPPPPGLPHHEPTVPQLHLDQQPDDWAQVPPDAGQG